MNPTNVTGSTCACQQVLITEASQRHAPKPMGITSKAQHSWSLRQMICLLVSWGVSHTWFAASSRFLQFPAHSSWYILWHLVSLALCQGQLVFGMLDRTAQLQVGHSWKREQQSMPTWHPASKAAMPSHGMQDVLHRSLPGVLAWLDLHLRPRPASLTAPTPEPSMVSPCLVAVSLSIMIFKLIPWASEVDEKLLVCEQ